uniref:SLC12A transporter C-terminal domain-containing protein n=1 Tax=Parascaris equorum TaxID=6256 RepID=A0A914RGY6_PAREQ
MGVFICFRPSFKYYSMWVSLAGALLCISLFISLNEECVLSDVNWGSSTQAHSYKNALQAMMKLANTEEHVKNYRPQLLVLTGNPAARPSLVDFVYNITKGSSLMICGYVVPFSLSFCCFQVSGLGKLRPNILIVGFKANWHSQGVDALNEINDYFGVIQCVAEIFNA